MTRASHTPGPWENDGGEITVGMYDKTGPCKHIATAWNNNEISPAEADANGRLMTAAPELLDLCRDMMTEADDTAIDIDEWSPEWQEMHARYLALMAKIKEEPTP